MSVCGKDEEKVRGIAQRNGITPIPLRNQSTTVANSAHWEVTESRE